MEMAGDPQGESQEILLGKLALERKFLTPDQLRDALAERAKSRPGGEANPRSLGNILVERGLLTVDQLVSLIDQSAAPGSGGVANPPLKGLGKYRLVRVLGRGGMGVVYEALDTALDRKVALKMMLPSPSAGPGETRQEEERFLREAKLSATLSKHPNIVSVYEAGVIDGKRYLAMELVEGKSFKEWKKTGSTALRHQVTLLRDVVLGVSHAHKQGVIHRDLKPENILVDGENRPHVTDFGLAKMIGQNVGLSLTAAGMVMGTPAYMSPEQAQGLKSIDGRTDIYSLGVMLYEILTGRQPFTGETAIEILMKAARNPVPRPSSIVKPGTPAVPDAAIENICLKAMAKNPKDRYATAEAFARDLTRWISGEEVRVIPPTTRKVYQPPKRWPKIAAGIAALVLVAAGALGAWYLTRPAPNPELAHAQKLLEAGNYADALKAYDEVLETDPENREARSGKVAAEAQLKLARAERKPDPAKRGTEGKRGVADPASTGSAEIPMPSDWSRATDLLTLIHPDHDSVSGTWTIQDGRLLSDRLARSRVEIPYRPPEEYDLRAVFTRVAGNGPIILVLSHSRRNFGWVMGAGPGGAVFGFEIVRGALAENNASTAKEPEGLGTGVSHTAIVQVRRDGLRVFYDGRLQSQLRTDYSDLGIPLGNRLRDPAILGLLTQGTSVSFERIELLTVSGAGEIVAPAPKPFLKAVALDGGKLRPGLIAEYCAGTAFEVPLLRRIDPSIDFRWGEGPPWPGGPCDWFSCRWSGYLKAPKIGEYTFSLTSDDGMRLTLDDQPVLANWMPHLETTNSVKVTLETGFHKISVEYFDEFQAATAILSWTDPASGKAVPVGGDVLFCRATDFRPLAVAPSPGLLATLGPQPHVIHTTAFLPDGTSLLSGSEDRTVRIWNVTSGKETRVIKGNPGAVYGVAVSPDGKLVAAATHGGKIRIWVLANGKEAATLSGHAQMATAVAWSPDGRMLVSGGSDRLVRIWEPAGEKEPKVLSGHTGPVTGVAWSPTRRMVVSSGADATVRLWDCESGKEIQTLIGHTSGVNAVAFSADGAFVASAGSDRTVRLWSMETGKEIRAFTGHTDLVRGVSFRGDGAVIASCGRDTTVRLWDVATGQELKVLTGHQGGVLSVAFPKDGKKLASCGYDATVRLWDVK